MENSPITNDNTNSKTQDSTDEFSVPVSTTPASAAPASSAPFVSDFKSSSIAPSTPSVQTPDASSPMSEATVPETSTEPASKFDFNKMDTPTTEPPKELQPKLSAPIRAQNYSNKGSKAMTIILVLILIAVIIGGIYGVYNWQHASVNRLTLENNSLNSQLAKVESELNAAQKQLASTAATGNTTVNLSAIGISLSVPTSLKDLTVATKTNPTKLTVNGVSVTPTEINLSSTSLSTLDSSCSTANAALGVLSKTSGTYPTTPTATNSSGTLIEQFSGYYIAYTAPLACSKVATTNSSQTTLVKDLEATLTKANITVL